MLEWKKGERGEKTGDLSLREKPPAGVGSARSGKARVDLRLVWNRPSVESLNAHWFYPGSLVRYLALRCVRQPRVRVQVSPRLAPLVTRSVTSSHAARPEGAPSLARVRTLTRADRVSGVHEG